MRKIPEIKPFLASLSYLTMEAQKQKLQEVLKICRKAEKAISHHIIEELFATEIARGSQLGEADYRSISEILIAASRMSPDQLDEFINHLAREDHIKPNLKLVTEEA